MNKAEDTKSEFAAASESHEPEFPTNVYIEIGVGAATSFADESRGSNSGAHNKSTDELRAVFDRKREAILHAATSDIRHLLETPSI